MWVVWVVWVVVVVAVGVGVAVAVAVGVVVAVAVAGGAAMKAIKNPHAQALGSLGGSAGTGKAKARSKKHCRAAQKKSVEARLRNKQKREQNHTNPIDTSA